MSRDWQNDMKTVIRTKERTPRTRTCCDSIGQIYTVEAPYVALEYWLQQYAAEKSRAIDFQEELNDLDCKYENLLEHSHKQKYKLAQEKERADIAELAYQGLTERSIDRGEYESLLDKHTAMTKAYRGVKEELARINATYYAEHQLFLNQRRELAETKAREQNLREAMEWAMKYIDGESYTTAYGLLESTLYPKEAEAR